MSDEMKNIVINLNLKNGDKIPTLLSQLQQVKQLADTAFQKASQGNVKSAQELDNLVKGYDKLKSKITDFNSTLNQNQFQSYSSQLSGMRNEAQKYFQLIQSGTGDVEAHKRKYAELKTSAEGVFNSMNKFNKDFGQLDRRIFSMSESLNYYFAKARQVIAA